MVETPKEWTVLSMLKWATSYFEMKGVKNPRFSIEWLLSHLLQVKRLDLYLLFDKPLSTDILEKLRSFVKRRASHEPLQYITGETDFLNTKIKVRKGVLIPRMETEQLVEILLNKIQDETALSILDIGTGSGCIPIAIKKNRPSWKVSATDISEEALTIAKENSIFNEVEISFLKDDILSSTFSSAHLFDIIISNPPYILEEERSSLDKEVVEFEPSLALFCKSTQNIYGAIEQFCDLHLKENGTLFLELHEHYAEEVVSLFSSTGWSSQLQKDYDGKNRFLIAKKI